MHMESAAKSLAKNPIGIVALFLVLIYGFTTLLLGLAGDSLPSAQRLPIIWFIVIFPVIVLAAFLFLVVFHHEKLYSPSEYRNERHFFRKLDPDEQRERLNKEVTEFEEALQSGDAPISQGYRPLRREEVVLKVSLAEDLAIRALEQQLGTTISRDVAVKMGDRWLNLDGAVVMNDELVAIEVKYSQGRGIPVFQIEHLLDLLSKHSLQRFRYVSVLLAIVSDASEENDRRIREKIMEATASSQIPIQLKFFRMAELKKQFGYEN